MSRKKPFRLNRKTIIIAAVVIVAVALLYFINAKNGGDNGALTSNLISAFLGDDAASDLQESNQQGPNQQESDNPEPNNQETQEYVTYKFRNNKLLTQHYEKHGIEMGFDTKEAYEKAACDVINNPDALHKTEKEDGDYVYYVEASNEFVILSTDGYIRTYFLPNAGISYYNRQ